MVSGSGIGHIFVAHEDPGNFMKLIQKYFPDLDAGQVRCFLQLGPLYSEWNEKINVISRKDISHLYERHVLHSMALAKVIRFSPGTRVIDLGTGGGFPGIPLAILFPEVKFILIDGTKKKIGVVEAISGSLGLNNVRALHCRAEEFKERSDFVVCRAVTRLETLLEWSVKLIHDRNQNPLPNGLLAFKGGQLKSELKSIGKGRYVETFPINAYFEEPYFEEKSIVYVQA